jgi:molybdate/tungstate transport system substrate-binding protein
LKIIIAAILIIASLMMTSGGCSSTQAKTKIVVFEADSLMVPLAAIEKEFETANPRIDVEIQAHGSIQVIRHVTELGEAVDVVAVADYSLVPLLMYKTPMANGKPFADWYIKPAANELVLAYTAKSKYADTLNSGNWYEIIARDDVNFGLADPRMDVVGYRAIMATKLAEIYYKQPAIFQNTIGRFFTMPLLETSKDNTQQVTVPELLEPSQKRMYLRGASMQLLSLLDSGDIDYAFEYRSVVAQRNLKYLELPPEISLGSEKLADYYKQVKVKIDYRRFKSVIPVFEGLPIAYGLAIPANTEHAKEAAKFIQFILGPNGQRIFKDNFNPQLQPPECDNVTILPSALRSFFK